MASSPKIFISHNSKDDTGNTCKKTKRVDFFTGKNSLP